MANQRLWHLRKKNWIKCLGDKNKITCKNISHKKSLRHLLQAFFMTIVIYNFINWA